MSKKVSTRWIEVDAGEGQRYDAYLALPPAGKGPGIVLFQDTSLVYVLSLADFFRTASTIGERDGTQVEMILFAGGVYFVISLSASLLVSWLKKRTV